MAAEIGRKDNEDGDSEDSQTEAEPSIVAFVITLMGSFLAGAVYISFAPLASVHAVDTLGWSSAHVGALVGCFGVTYSLFCTLAGEWCDSSPTAPVTIFLAGAFMAFASNLMISSGVLMPVKWQGVSLIGGAVLQGVSQAMLVVPSLPVLKSCAPRSCSDSSKLVAANSVHLYLGCAFGPIIMLPVSLQFGFYYATLGIAVVSFAYGVVASAVYCGAGKLGV